MQPIQFRYRYKRGLTLLFIWALAACERPGDARKEIRQAEASFAAMAARDGVEKAFLAFADDSAVINRAGRIYKGKKAIAGYYQALPFRSVQLNWTPEAVEAAGSGDLGYTYGHYLFRAIDSLGKPIESTGIFHTVWKKQADGSWRFVYD